MLMHKNSKYFFPAGVIALILLPCILILYTKDHPLLNQRCLEAYTFDGIVDYFSGLNSYHFEKTDFPNSAKLDELKKYCLKNDSLKMGLGSTKIFFSRDCSYQDFIAFLDLLQTTNHYAVFMNSGKSFDIEYRYKEREDNFTLRMTRWTDSLIAIGRLRAQPNSYEPSEIPYIAQAFSENKALYIIIFFWFSIFVLNIVRVIEYHKQRRLTRRSS
jgi:hypothetical protein